MTTTNAQSGTRIDEIEDGIFRIHTPVGDIPGGFSFNQYLVVDEEPVLFHTGPRRMFPLVRQAIAHAMPVEKLRWVGFSHYEADECGALNEFLAVAPNARPLCSNVAAMVSVNDVADRQARGLADGEQIAIGRHPHLARHPALATRLGVRVSRRCSESRSLLWGPVYAAGCGACARHRR